MVQPTQSNVQRRLSPLFRSIPWNAIDSECIRLSGAALVILITLAKGLGTDFDPLLSFSSQAPWQGYYFESKRLFFRKSRGHTAPWYNQFSKDKSPTIWLMVAEGHCTVSNAFNPPELEQDHFALKILVVLSRCEVCRRSGRNFFGLMKCCFRIEVRLSTLSSLNYSQLSRFAAPLTPMAHKRLLGAIPHPAAG